MTRLATGLIAFGLGAAILFTAGPLAADGTARFAAGQQGSQNYGVNAAFGQAIESLTELDVSVQSFGGATAYLPLLDAGEVDFAAVVTPDVGDAVRGSGPFDGNQLASIRLVAALFPSPVGLLVRDDSGIDSIADLAGKRVAAGFTAQASLVPYVEGALANGGLGLDDVTLVPVVSVGTGVDELIADRVDATLFALRGGKVVEADAAIGVRWLPFDSSETAVTAMQAAAPEAYLVAVDAGDEVIGVDALIETMAYDYVLLTNAAVSDADVATVARLLLEEGAAIAEAAPVLGAISPEALTRRYADIPHHPAAATALGIKAD